MKREQILQLIAVEETEAQARKLAIRHGIKPSDLPMTTGQTITLERTGYRWRRPAVIELPTAREAFEKLIATVEAEERQDAVLNIKQLGIDPDSGWLTWKTEAGEGSRPYSRRAFGQLCSLLDVRPNQMANCFLSMTPPRRSWNVSEVIDDNAPRTVKLRFRRSSGDEYHHAFACVSEDYRDFDPDRYAREHLELLGDEADRYRCAVTYGGTWARAYLVALNEAQDLDRNHTGAHAAAQISSADDGSQSVDH